MTVYSRIPNPFAGTLMNIKEFLTHVYQCCRFEGAKPTNFNGFYWLDAVIVIYVAQNVCLILILGFS